MSDPEKIMNELAPLLPLLRAVERRIYAAMAMQQFCRTEEDRTYKEAALMAVLQADALIASLDDREAR